MLCLAGLVLASAPGCRSERSAPASPPAPAESHRRVILLLLDAARPDRFSCYGYPRVTTPEIDLLAARGVVFEHHYAQGTGTRESIPALLYSRYFSVPIFPSDPQVPYSRPEDLFRRPDDEQISLPAAFERAGFLTAAISAHLWTGRETPFAAEFLEMHDLTVGHQDRRYPYPRARQVIDFTIDWLRQNHDRDVFLYVHLMDTHYPHYFEEDAQELFGAPAYSAENFRDGGGVEIPAERLSEDDRRYVDALYDGSLRYADRQIGRLAGFLRDQGWLEDAVLAITADHGEHLLGSPGEGPRPGTTVFSHGGAWLEPVARIPLILHYPGSLAAGRFAELSEGVDVAPTLLGLAGVSLPAGKAFDGTDLVAVISGRSAAKEQVLVRGGGIRTATHKALFAAADRVLLATSRPETGKGAAVRPADRLYDLVLDPGERNDLTAAEPALAGGLLDRYREIMTAPYQRAEAARTNAQPSAAFAISVRHVRTAVRLPKVQGAAVPAGWSRLYAEPHSALIARATEEPLSVRFPIPDGHYRLNLGLVGSATVEVNGRRQALSSRGLVEFGDVEVTGGSFRATIHPRSDQMTRVLFFGFVPAAAVVDPAADAERLRRLEALGYVQ